MTRTNHEKFPLRILLPTIVCLLVCALIWPLKLIGRSDYTHACSEKSASVSSPLTAWNMLSGSFYSGGDNLKSLSFKLYTDNESTGHLYFNLYDEYGETIYYESRALSEVNNNHFVTFDVALEDVAGQIFTYELYAVDCESAFPCVYLVPAAAFCSELLTCFVGTEMLMSGPLMSFTYTDRMSSETMRPYALTLLAIAILITLALPYSNCRHNTRKISTLKVFCLTLLGTLIAILCLLSADESKTPVTLSGNRLRHDVGAVQYNYLHIDESYSYSGVLCTSPHWTFDAGTYTLGLEYTTDSDNNKLLLYDNDVLYADLPISKDTNYDTFTFTLDKDTQDFTVKIQYGGTGNLNVSSLEVSAADGFYNDTAFFITVVIVLFLFGWLLYGVWFFRCQNSVSPGAGSNIPTGFLHSKGQIVLLLIFLGIFATFPYFQGYLPWGDDLCYHLVRIEGIKDGLRDGQFPVIIYPEGLSGHGYLNCMYPNLFLYIPAVLRLFGISISTCYKTLILLFNIMTACITYYSVKLIAADMKVRSASACGLLATVLYMLCPYRYTNLFARGALGEALAMTFFPLLIAGLYEIFHAEHTDGTECRIAPLILGVSGLLQTHILSCMLGLVICVIWGILRLGFAVRKRRIFSILKVALWTLALNLWYLVPFVYFYVCGNLSTQSLDWSNYSEYSLNMSGLIGTINTSDYRTLTLGIAIVLCIAIAFVALTENISTLPDNAQPNECDRSAMISNRRFLFGLLVAGVLCTYMIIQGFPARTLMKIRIFYKFFSTLQFPWRLLGLASLFFILAGSLCLYQSRRLSRYAPALFAVLVGISVLSAGLYTEEDYVYESYDSDYSIAHEKKLVGIPKGENTIVYPYEWRPLGTVLRDTYTLTDGDITIVSYERYGTTTTLTYTCTDDNQFILLPIISYAGYDATNETGQKQSVSNGYGNGLLIELQSDGDEHTITVQYNGLWYFNAGYIGTMAGIVVAIIVAMRKRKKKKNL